MATSKSATPSRLRKAVRGSSGNAIELVLGGGGIKGFAHVGFLKAVEELKIDCGTVTGVSIGSIIAVLYVNGFSVDEIESIFAQELKAINPKKLARSMLLPASLDRLIFGEEPVSLLNLMKNLVKRYKLKPKNNLRLIAYNAVTREPVVFSGRYYDLASAMAASCSIPFVFRPIENGEEISLAKWVRNWLRAKLRQEDNDDRELLFDGGLFHPTPVHFCQGKAIVARLGFASEPSTEELSFADRLFHKLEQHASRVLDGIFPDPTGDHIVIHVGSADVAALSFGISPRQQKALSRTAYKRTLAALKPAVAEGRVPLK